MYKKKGNILMKKSAAKPSIIVCLLVLGLVYISLAATHRADPKVFFNPATQLMITDLRVVEDPIQTNPNAGAGATWIFKYLIENMVGENDPEEFTLRWMKHWEEDQVVNGQASTARAAIREKVIEPWLETSGGVRLDLSSPLSSSLPL